MNLKVLNLKYETNLFHDEQHRKQSNYNIFIRPTTYYKKIMGEIHKTRTKEHSCAGNLRGSSESQNNPVHSLTLRPWRKLLMCSLLSPHLLNERGIVSFLLGVNTA